MAIYIVNTSNVFSCPRVGEIFLLYQFFTFAKSKSPLGGKFVCTEHTGFHHVGQRRQRKQFFCRRLCHRSA